MASVNESSSSGSYPLGSSHSKVLDLENTVSHDLDVVNELNDCLNHIRNQCGSNFVLDFNDETASVSLDLSDRSVEDLLQDGVSATTHARWINVWNPFTNQSLLKLLATRYDFSPRLLALMCSEPLSAIDEKKPTESERESLRSWYRRKKLNKTSRQAANATSLGFPCPAERCDPPSAVDGNLYRLLENMWHYTSVDWGREYLCIGYNSLYTIQSLVKSNEHDPLTRCIRVWTWLILCDDGTVISINEDPLSSTRDQSDLIQQQILRETRRNTCNVLTSLSRAHQDNVQLPENPMALFPIRARPGATPEETAHRASDAPSLLFYYIFENWHNSYIMVSRRESWYGAELARIRAEMFASPKLEHIDHLDNLSRELGVLRRHYGGHSRLISRLLEPQSLTTASVDNLRRVGIDKGDDVDARMVESQVAILGAPISSAARARFKRLKDLVEVYALSEVDEYIKQKDSLVAMNFSLIAIKESLDVEKLTRITLMLTKATFLFLPVSLMTAYFSVQLRDIEYDLGQYWIGFVVVLALSWLAMFVFGIFSGDASSARVLQPILRILKKCRSFQRAMHDDLN